MRWLIVVLCACGRIDFDPLADTSTNPQALCMEQWCWEAPLPQGDQILAMHGTTASDIWAVGGYGLVMHYDGSEWSYSRVGVDDLVGVRAFARDDVWIAGQGPDEGFAYHYDGTGWTKVLMPVHPTLGMVYPNGLWGTARDDMWIGGYNGLIARYDGSTWSAQVPGGTSTDYNAGCSTARDNTYLLADGITYHYDGNAFDTAGYPSGVYSFCWGTAADDMWLADVNNQSFHYNGASWAAVPKSPADFYSLVAGWSPAKGEAWISGYSGVLLHGTRSGVDLVSWDGDGILAMWGSDATNAWGGGTGGRLLHFDGVTWTPTLSKAENVFLSIDGTSADDLWAVGDDAIWRRDATGTWTAMEDVPATALKGVFVLAPDDVWVWGYLGAVYRWNGSAWSTMSPSDREITALWASGPDDVWAIGRGPVANTFERLHYDGAGWYVVPLAGTSIAIWGFGRNDVWSNDGADVLHFDGAQWTSMFTMPGTLPVGFAGTSSSDLLVMSGQSLHQWNGSSLTLLESAQFAGRSGLQQLVTVSPTRTVLVDAQWNLFEWDGAAVREIEYPSGNRPTGGWSDGESLWIVGYGGTILRKTL